MNLKHVFTGWARRFGWIKTTETIEQLSEARLRMCQHCKFSEKSFILEVVNGKGNYVDSLYCTKCTCPCLEKSLVPEEQCPIKKW